MGAEISHSGFNYSSLSYSQNNWWRSHFLLFSQSALSIGSKQRRAEEIGLAIH